jgi:signal peptidase I
MQDQLRNNNNMIFYKETLIDKIRDGLDRTPLFSNRYFSLTEFWDKNTGFIVFIFFLILFKIFIFNVNVIPSSSMNPNLLVGDYVLVNKLKWIYDKPEVGDVVTFEVPNSPYMVKRVVGSSGSNVKFYDGYLFIDDEKLVLDSYEDSYVSSDELVLSEYVKFKPFIESNGGADYKVIFPDTLPRRLYEETKHNYFTENVLVPEGEYYLSGDNRFFSKDSRYYKTVPEDALIGQPVLVIVNLRFLKDKIVYLFTLDFDNFMNTSWDLRFFETIK